MEWLDDVMNTLQEGFETVNEGFETYNNIFGPPVPPPVVISPYGVDGNSPTVGGDLFGRVSGLFGGSLLPVVVIGLVIYLLVK